MFWRILGTPFIITYIVFAAIGNWCSQKWDKWFGWPGGENRNE